MDLNYLKKVIRIFDISTLSEMTIEEEGVKIKLSKNKDNAKKQNSDIPYPNIIPVNQTADVKPNPGNNGTNPENPEYSHNDINVVNSLANSEEKSLLHTIHSPIVGTFYKSPSPDSEPFVDIGSHVTKGETLCIIEAMKLMNEIESDIPGTVVKILVDNSQPVEFNQPLFIIKPD
jgi:acetyl-CoA carboxylase biotin carboxyl carrier protein